MPAPVTEGDGQAMLAFMRELFPLCRSITGPGLRETVRRVAGIVPLEIHEVPTGTRVLDWTIPREWTLRGGWIATTDGRRLVDAAGCNLHVVGYSGPVDRLVSRAELARHVHTLPDQPTLVPYRTAYHADDWAFCLSDDTWRAMTDDAYRVVIDSTLAPGSMTYGELLIPGRQADEVLIHAHCCHPSLANDNLSGVAVAAWLARRLLGRDNRLSYRFIFAPGTIGAIAWLARNAEAISRIRHGLVLTCVGDSGRFHYKRSRSGAATIDRLVAKIAADLGEPLVQLPYTPWGYDERQYGSPAFDLPVGCFMRSPGGSFPEYHTSADNMEFVDGAALERSLDVLTAVLDAADGNVTPRRIDGRGEPQLGRRGLLDAAPAEREAMLWALNLSDGRHSILDMAERSGLPFRMIAAAAVRARDAGLLVEDDAARSPQAASSSYSKPAGGLKSPGEFP